MIIYTAIFGGYDKLNEYPTGCQKICFTDLPHLESETWDIVRVEHESKIHRKIKILPHLFLPPHDRSVWIDGHLSPNCDIEKFAAQKPGFWAMTHPLRTCTYAEAQECIALRKDNPRTIQRQIARYRQAAYPYNNGMVATGVLIREPGYEKMLEDWWSEVRDFSVRDQISFNFIAHKHSLQFNTFPYLYGFTNHYHVTDKRHQRFNKSPRPQIILRNRRTKPGQEL